MVDIDLGRLHRWECDYDTFLDRKAQQLEIDAKMAQQVATKLKHEEVWVRQGVQARRTRSQDRVNALIELRKVHRARRTHATLQLEIDQGDRSGKLVKELVGVTKRYADNTLIRNLNLTIRRGDRLGILGPNGCGKSTLLRILLEDEPVDAGTVKSGTRLQVAYFDQVRAQLDHDMSVADAIADGRSYVTINDREVHVVTYLANFMFTPEHARSPVKVLSGGEQNRLLLAKLFSLPANLLVLDEPTNDLDVESLELLEELLLDYAGTVLLVTHDRAFLDNVVTSLVVFEGNGKLTEYVGGYSDWRESGHDFALPTVPAAAEKIEQAQPVGAIDHKARRQHGKVIQQQAKALARVTADIEKTEVAIARLHEQMAAPGFYEQASATRDERLAELARAESALEALYARWEALELDASQQGTAT
ncbi:MAG: ATP-binding cassette domain-containing protein [Gammaproteobacteria bacterium]|nr:ATP-binding cassette domain-containing protein [Gammaproteobacteria bacterium]